MVQLYRFGNPFETDAVEKKMPAQPASKLPYFTFEKGSGTFLLPLQKQTAVYGLGENVRGINKRGWIYKSNCTDDPQHTEGKNSLYAAHNFILIANEHPFGAFFDYPGKMTFDIGYTDSDLLSVSVGDLDLDIYILEGGSLKDIVHQFRHIIGRSYIAPKWAFGYGQSRWGYRTEDQVREVVRKHRENKIPLDSVYLDIDYMEHYKDFTINENTFPNFSRFVDEMKQQNIHLVPVIDAGVKAEDGYDVCDEGKKKGYFCKKKDGSLFVGAVWPGDAYFPDFLNKDVRNWFGRKYGFMLEKGIDGFWNDMNEPAIFYSKDGLKKLFAVMEKLKGKNLDIEKFGQLQSLFRSLGNNPKDYQSFYHNCNGKPVCHDKVHNLYGYNMTRAAGEAFEELAPNRRILIFSRSSYIGMHRYGGIWTGDNCSWWNHLLLEIQMMPSLSMCGFLYAGADIGGFGCNTTADLLLRWLEFGIFTPLMRNHSACGTRRQEVYQFKKMIPTFRNIIGIRYGLLPYLYSEYMKAALNDSMYFKPLSFEYPKDPNAVHVEDQLLLGDEIMVAPVYKPNAAGRTVYLPEPMQLITMRSLHDFTVRQMEKGLHYIPVALNEVIFFIRPDRIVPLSSGGESVPEVNFNSLYLLGNIKKQASYVYYSDDGYKKDYENPNHYSVIHADRNGNFFSDGALRLTLHSAINSSPKK